MGQCLRALGRSPLFVHYVEIGSATGKGSTRQLMDGILSRSDDSALYSVECDPLMHAVAQSNWHGRDAGNRLYLIHGSIIQPHEMMTPDEAKTHPLYHRAEVANFVARTWQKHHAAIAAAPDATRKLPESIDVLLLDGGEFSSYAEFIKLRDRARVIVLDDSHHALKNYLTRKALQRDPEWRMILERPNGRNYGWCIFCRAAEETSVRSALGRL